MTSTELPPLSFGDGGFRISIFAGPDDDTARKFAETNEPTESKPAQSSSSRAPDTDDNNPDGSLVENLPIIISGIDDGPTYQDEPEYSTRSTEADTQQRVHSGHGPESFLDLDDESDSEQGEDLELKEQQPTSDQPQALASQEERAPEAKDARTKLEPDTNHETRPEPEPESASAPSPSSNIPTHPVPSMQEAFAESLQEVTAGGPSKKPNLREVDPPARREQLLAQDPKDAPLDATWRYRQGQTQHEVFKLVSQISFGVYLLLNGMANNNAQVVSILQGHIDEIDEFLEVALQDQDEASRDLKERRGHLKLPLTNMRTFEGLLEDRAYRAELLEGNQKIEHVVARTGTMVRMWEDDAEKGLTSSLTFQAWLRGLDRDGAFRRQPDLLDAFEAMQGNAEGWLNAFNEMNSRSRTIKSYITDLNSITMEIEQKVGEVSRKTWASVQPFSSPSSSNRSFDASSTRSPHSSRVVSHSKSRTSMRTPSVASPKSRHEDNMDEFPLPGAAPLLPPPRSSARPRTSASPPETGKKLHMDTALSSHPPTVKETEEIQADEAPEDGPLYILQPRTYTPQPPEPLPSPMLKDSPVITSDNGREHQALRTQHSSLLPQRKTSVRERVSLRTEPPQDIRIPPPRVELPGHDRRPSSSHHATPRTANSVARDSAYGSEMGTPRQRSRVGSSADMSPPPPTRPSLVPSPRSDHQHFRPVNASPHSPLQQRPHTAAGPSTAAQHRATMAASYYPQHQRNQPSRLGGMSTLSRVTLATHEGSSVAGSSAATQAGDKRLKKKKSAFGWLKKAFSMDEEEKAAFEARKTAMQQADTYYSAKSPKFLDGKRLR